MGRRSARRCARHASTPPTYQAQLDQALAKKAQNEALLENAKRDLERYARLAETNSVTKQQADTQRATVAQLEAQLKSDQAAIDSAARHLAYTHIVAPIDGRTGIRAVDEGNIVKRPTPTASSASRRSSPSPIVFSVPQQQFRASTRRGRRARAGRGDGCRQHRPPIDKGVLTGHRQPGGPDDRHGAAEGGIPQPRHGAVAGRVRQCAPAASIRCATSSWCRPPPCSAGPRARSSMS